MHYMQPTLAALKQIIIIIMIFKLRIVQLRKYVLLGKTKYLFPE